MVYAYHVIFTTYGFWLPNDPRGSWSDFVGAWELYRYGPATQIDERQSVAYRPHNQAARKEAKEALKYPAVHFNGLQARAAIRGFAESAQKGRVTVWACSILPEHVHMVIARHRYKVETLVNYMKGAETRKLLKEELHPFAAFADEDGIVPKCWARGQWKVYLDDVEDILRAIHYVEDNPMKEGKRRQDWDFVTPFTPELIT